MSAEEKRVGRLLVGEERRGKAYAGQQGNGGGGGGVNRRGPMIDLSARAGDGEQGGCVRA